MNQISNPFSDMLLSLAPDKFFGRREEIDLILQGTSSQEPRSFAIHGAKTIGKTSLLKFLCHPDGATTSHFSALVDYSPRSTDKLEFLYIDFYMKTGTLSNLYRNLLSLDEIRRTTHLSLAPEFVEIAEKSELKQSLRDVLRTLWKKKLRLVICLDHFDRAFQAMSFEDDVFLRDLTSYQAFVVATEQSLPSLRRDPRRTSPLVNVLIPRNIGLLSVADAKELIQVPVQDTEASFTPLEVQFILETAGRQPYLLTVVCEFLFKLRVQYPEIDETLLQDEKMTQQVLLQLEALPAVTELFELFGNPLSESEWQTLSKVTSDETIDLEREQYALNTLSQKALIFESWRDGRFLVFSELFRRFVRRQRRIHPKEGIDAVADSLAPLDRRLLEYLRARPNQICTFEELLAGVWENASASKRGLEAAIYRLRSTIEGINETNWEYIQNIRGKGYRYTPRPQQGIEDSTAGKAKAR